MDAPTVIRRGIAAHRRIRDRNAAAGHENATAVVAGSVPRDRYVAQVDRRTRYVETRAVPGGTILDSDP